MKFLPRPATLFFLGLTILFFSMAFMSGCATQTLIKVDPMVFCDDGVDPKLLTEPCDSSTPLPQGSTYEVGLNGKRTGDTSLGRCGIKVSKLQEVIKVCHTATANHNSLIQSLNKQ